MTETVYTISGTPDPNAANPVSPTLADAVTAARVYSQKSTDAAASAAASAISADVSADAVTAVVSGVVGQVTADAAQVAADRIAVRADALAADADAGTAAASAAAALSSEGTASSAAISSASSASTASGNAVSAAASFNSFHNIYYGPSATNPSTRPDTTAIQSGDLYYNTSSNSMKIYTGSAWASAAFDTSGALVAGNNLSELTDKKAARNNLGVDGRTSRGNADYSILVTDIVVAITTAFTAPRTFTLPGAAYVNAGACIRIIDEVGAVSATNTLTVASLVVSDVNDTINGGTSIVFGSGRVSLIFTSDGVSKWSAGVTSLVSGGTGSTTASAARTAFGLGTAATRDAGAVSGVATLDGSGKVPSTQLPALGSPFPSTAKSANYTTAVTDNGMIIAVTTGSSTDVTITLGLPNLSSDGAGDGALHGIQKVDSGTKRVIVLDSNGSTVIAWLTSQWDLVIFKSNGTVWKPFIITISPLVDTFTASGTWTKPPLAASVKTDVQAAGGGGGSGRRGLVSEAKSGGNGAAGGAFFTMFYNSSDLSSTETVTIGAAGTAGAAQTSNNTNGIAGGTGGTTTFGSRLTVAGGTGGVGGNTSGGSSSSGGGALGATASGAAVGFEGGTGGNRAIYGGAGNGVSSATVASSAGASSWFGGGGGGGGGGETVGDALLAAAAGGLRGTVTAGGGGAAGTSNASSPTAGTAGSGAGSGGGGGGSAQSAAAAAGGAGGIGAGGGGGGSSRNGLSSGAGGAGGAGQCVVTTFFLPN